MSFLKRLEIRIILSIIVANMVLELVSPGYKMNVLPFLALVLLSALGYYGLTKYVNNSK